MELTNESIKIATPFRGIIAGPSNSGKTYFITRLLQNRIQLISQNFNRIIFCHPFTEHINEKEKVFFHSLETMARYELQCEIIDKIKNNDYFASLLLKSMNEDSIMNTPKYILETLRDKSIQNLKYFENILIASSHYDFIWKNFIKN